MNNAITESPVCAPKLPADSPELITSREVARLLSVAPRTVWRLLERGELPPPVRFNRKLVRWHRPTLLRHIESYMSY